MKTEIYEKPMLKFASLRNEDAVANTCWGYHGTDTLLYCDIPGEGYVSFQIGAGSCSLNLINVTYYKNENDSGIKIVDGDSRYDALEKILIDTGGESGNPYKGEGSTIIPDHPGNWS